MKLLAMFTDQPGTSSHDLVQTYWKSQHPTGDFEAFWRTSVHDGFVAGSASPAKQVSPKLGALPPQAASDATRSKFRSVPTPPFMTARSSTTPGCRKRPSR